MRASSIPGSGGVWRHFKDWGNLRGHEGRDKALDLVQQFSTRFESLKGVVHTASGDGDAVRIALSICADAVASAVALSHVPKPFQAAFVEGCRDSGVAVVAPPYSNDTLPGAIDRAQVGVSMAHFAIAQTGTLVEVDVDDACRIVSCLPRTHICLVRNTDFVPELYDAAPRLRSIFQENERNCVVSFISGPSRTGDIEMKLTLGVHGPEQAHVIVVYDE